MIGQLIQTNMFQDQYTALIKDPINNGYGGLMTGAKIGMAVKRINQMNKNPELSMVQKMGNKMYLIGFILALIPIIVIRPSLTAWATRAIKLYMGSGSMTTAIASILTSLLNKMSSNFILSAILIPIFGLISIIFLIIGEAIGDTSKLDKSSTMFITPITTKEVIQKFVRATKYLSMRLSTEFPMVTKIFSFILNIFNKLHNAYRNIKSKITASIKGNQESEDPAKMESIGIGKLLGGAFFVGVIVMLLKKTKIGGFFALFTTMIFALSPKAKNFVRRIPYMMDIFKLFRSAGSSLSKRFNLGKIFQQFMEYARNLKIAQSLYSTFSSK